MRRAALVTLLLTVGAAAPTSAQAIAWRAEQFACAVFEERRTTDIRSETAGRARQETVRRAGVFIVTVDRSEDGARSTARASREAGVRAPSDSTDPAVPVDSLPDVPLMAFYDSLALERLTPDGPFRPDTDGMLGGQFVGRLSPDGVWIGTQRPFVPNAVAEVSNVAATMDDFFPRLPAFALREGGRWRDASGAETERLADSLAADGTKLLRLMRRLTVRGRPSLATGVAGEGAEETTEREERMLLHPKLGLLQLERRVSVTTDLPVGPTVRTPMKAGVVERSGLRRRIGAVVDGCR